MTENIFVKICGFQDLIFTSFRVQAHKVYVSRKAVFVQESLQSCWVSGFGSTSMCRFSMKAKKSIVAAQGRVFSHNEIDLLIDLASQDTALNYTGSFVIPGSFDGLNT